MHNMALRIMYSVAVAIVYPLMHYACVACERVLGWYTHVLFSVEGRGRLAMSLYKLKATSLN